MINPRRTIALPGVLESFLLQDAEFNSRLGLIAPNCRDRQSTQALKTQNLTS